jgi:ATP-dependent helicase/nuclease subunit A
MTTDRERLLRADAEARRLAHTEFERPLVVDAGAGTGKTALLTARVVAWLLGPGWQRHAVDGDNPARRVIERVVAITFTEAAAAEMAQRVAEALSELARGGEPPPGIDADLVAVAGDERAERAAALADEVHRLQAQTIHSWCHRLLSAFPLEAGLHPGFEVDDDGTRVEAMVEEVVEDALRGLADQGPDPDWELLATAGVVPAAMAEALGGLVANGVTPDELRRDPFGAPVVEAGIVRLRALLDDFWRVEAGLLVEVGASKTSVRAREALAELTFALERLDGAVTIHELIEAGQPVGDTELARLRDWAKPKFNATEIKTRGEAAEAVADAAAPLAPLVKGLTELAPDELAAARRVLAELLEEVRSRMRVRGIVTFEDLLRGTVRLMEGSERVRRELRLAIDQLMVDEFQDTDRTQCEIVRWLALDGPDGERPGLFIVGDPKQSIYGWRRADLAAYDAFKALVVSSGGVVQPLVRSFRSVQPILDEVERVVAPVMEEATGVQPPFQPLEATDERRTDPGFTSGDRSTVEHWAVWPLDPETGEPGAKAVVAAANDLEATALAADIRRLHDRDGAAWGDIAVLLRITTQQEIILDRFREAEIPFEVARERDYYRQREVVEAAALMRCVLEPGDPLALLTVLRSDAVGVPDAALVPLWDAGLPALMADLDGPAEGGLETIDRCIERARQAVPADLPGADALPRWPLAVGAAVETVAVLRASVRTDAPDIFVERMRTLWLVEATASARYLGRYRRARLERFFTQLEEELAVGDGSLAPVARFLRRAVEEGRESALPPEPDVTADAVHVMTIHGAKGLDFEHVYLAQIHRGEGRGPWRTEAEVLRSAAGVEYRLFGWPTLGCAEAEALRKLRERAERVRLLYVAMTRAKRRLVLSGRWQDDGELVPAGRAVSFADLVAHRADPAALEAQVGDRLHRWAEHDRPVGWVLPAFDEAEVDHRQPAADAPAPDVEAVREDAARLREARAAAAQRSALPHTARVTDLAHQALLPEPSDDEEAGSAPRDAASAVGSAVHRLLEDLDLAQELGTQLEERRREVEAELSAMVAAERLETARARLIEVLDRLATGACLGRLGEIADQVLARELPLLLPPDGEAVGAIVGTADLVYRDNGRLVVADYKTDAVADDDEISERTELYRAQLELYARALSDALELPEAPLTELWFLHADRIVRL